jgi:hypothetical protein
MTTKFPLLPFQQVLVFQKTFLLLRSHSNITRHQVLFLCLLMAHGLTDNFRANDVPALGIEYNLGRKYLMRLEDVGFVSKNGILWTITPAAKNYYQAFAHEFHAKISLPFSWK